MHGIARRRWLGNPEIYLKRTSRAGAELLCPFFHFVWTKQQGGTRAHAAGIRHRDRQRRRACAGHRREQNRKPQTETFAKRINSAMHV
jgi:hypothetical protein